MRFADYMDRDWQDGQDSPWDTDPSRESCARDEPPEPPPALIGPPPNYAHYRARCYEVLGSADSLFQLALDERNLQRGWAQMVAEFTGEGKASTKPLTKLSKSKSRSAGHSHRSA